MSTPPRLRDLPSVSTLSEQQVRGVACVYCGVILCAATAVDLGERRSRRPGGSYSWYPRACRLHGLAA
ncbi:hypothetical protein ACFV0B_11620 [Streptomyces xanthophaeus]|uniref:hypothetical protein n=1 Tax=Streptomyces xanthophaeus TaxID=67385 RepID=UPI00368A2ECD